MLQRAAGLLLLTMVCACQAEAGEPNTDRVAPAEASASVQELLETAADHLRVARPREALATLESVESAEPGNPWAWFYRGVAWNQLDEPYRSLDALNRCLDILAALGDPDPLLRSRAQGLRDRVRRRVFSLSWTTGLAYDTNVTFLGDDASALGLVAGEDDGRFMSRLDLAFAPVADHRQTLVLAGRTAHSWHFDLDSFDDQLYGLSARYTRRPGSAVELGLGYDWDFTLLGRQSYLCRHAATASVERFWPDTIRSLPGHSTLVYYRLELRDFLFEVEPDFDQDGLAHAVGLEHEFFWRPLASRDWLWEIRLAYRFRDVDTEGTEFERQEHDLAAGVTVPLMHPRRPSQYLVSPDKPLLLRMEGGYSLADYRNPSLIDRRARRRDDAYVHAAVTLSQTLTDDADRGTLVLHLIAGWNESDSNIESERGVEPFGYDQWVYGFQVQWSW